MLFIKAFIVPKQRSQTIGMTRNMCLRRLSSFALVFVLGTVLKLFLPEVFVTEASGQEKSFIQLKKIGDRTWLVDSSGHPFFAHGVTHFGNQHGVDVVEIGNACKKLGFNAMGYGCAPELKSDLPFVEGRNLIPMSMYQTTDGSFSFVDIFDRVVQSKLEQQIKEMCFANCENPNLIGYCWTDLGAWPLENNTGKNWVNFIRGLPDDAPGQRSYRAFLEKWNGGDEQARDQAFLIVIAREYYRVHGEANRKYDPDHLIFGDRFSFPTIDEDVTRSIQILDFKNLGSSKVCLTCV